MKLEHAHYMWNMLLKVLARLYVATNQPLEVTGYRTESALCWAEVLLVRVQQKQTMVGTTGFSHSHQPWLVPADQCLVEQDFEMVCQVACQHYDTIATQMEFQVSCILVA